jgi:hypothetical protein
MRASPEKLPQYSRSNGFYRISIGATTIALRIALRMAVVTAGSARQALAPVHAPSR